MCIKVHLNQEYFFQRGYWMKPPPPPPGNPLEQQQQLTTTIINLKVWQISVSTLSGGSSCCTIQFNLVRVDYFCWCCRCCCCYCKGLEVKCLSFAFFCGAQFVVLLLQEHTLNHTRYGWHLNPSIFYSGNGNQWQQSAECWVLLVVVVVARVPLGSGRRCW